MKRKDCDNLNPSACHRGPVLRSLLCAIIAAAPAVAGTVRVRPSAIVVADETRLGDVCDFAGFDPIAEQRVADAILGVSPTAGSSTTVYMQSVREALRRTEVNMADVTLSGATQCLVSRPANQPTKSFQHDRRPSRLTPPDGPAAANEPAVTENQSLSSPQTLRDAVYSHFTRALKRYRGRPEIVFDRTDTDVLSLEASTHTFSVRTRKEDPLGLVQVEVDVVANGQDARTVPLVVSVSMMRDVLVARRAINQGATLSATDIDRVSLIFTRVDGKLGVVDADRIIGKRAKRFIPPGSVIHLSRLESVPLVSRGQFVRLRSREGGIQVVTSGKAMQGGMLGESITVRSLDRARLQFEATIVGAGVVEVGSAPASSATIADAQGGPS